MFLSHLKELQHAPGAHALTSMHAACAWALTKPTIHFPLQRSSDLVGVEREAHAFPPVIIALRYTGDVSSWGNRRVSDFYDDKTNSESNFTMSSGLSPRDTKPREREFDIEAAKKVRGCNLGCVTLRLPRSCP